MSDCGKVRLSELFEPLSATLGIPVKTISEVSKYLRISGLLPAAKDRRNGTAFVGANEAATLLLGVLGSDTVAGGREAVFRLSGLQLAGITARYTAADGTITERSGFHDMLASGDVPDLWFQPFRTFLAQMIESPNGGCADAILAQPIGIWVSRTRALAIVAVAFDCPGAVSARVEISFSADETGAPAKIDKIPRMMEVSACAPATVLLALNAALNSSAVDYPVNSAAVH